MNPCRIVGTLDADGVVHPGPIEAWRVNHDCVFLGGYPHCMGAAARGDGDCTCDNLRGVDYERCAVAAWDAHEARKGESCADCLFRSRDPEWEHELWRMANEDGPFFCHVAMPINAVGGVPQRDSFCPKTEATYPICAGWERARKRLLRAVKPDREIGHLSVFKGGRK